MVAHGKASAVTKLDILALLSHFGLHRHCNAYPSDKTNLLALEALEVYTFRFKSGCLGDDVGAVFVMQPSGRPST